MGRFGLLRPARLRRMARARALMDFVLRDDALVQLFFDAQQLLGLFFLDRSDGNAGPARDDVFDIFAVDYAGGRFIEMIFFAEGAQVLALFAFFVGVEAGFFELVVRDGVLHAMDDELDALLDFGQFLGQAKSGAV